MHEKLGGFGTVLVMGFDHADNPDAWYGSLQLLANEVAPRIQHLKEPVRLAELSDNPAGL
jgi:hypothetical protein